jgi:hypothetical protein
LEDSARDQPGGESFAPSTAIFLESFFLGRAAKNPARMLGGHRSGFERHGHALSPKRRNHGRGIAGMKHTRLHRGTSLEIHRRDRGPSRALHIHAAPSFFPKGMSPRFPLEKLGCIAAA